MLSLQSKRGFFFFLMLGTRQVGIRLLHGPVVEAVHLLMEKNDLHRVPLELAGAIYSF